MAMGGQLQLLFGLRGGVGRCLLERVTEAQLEAAPLVHPYPWQPQCHMSGLSREWQPWDRGTHRVGGCGFRCRLLSRQLAPIVQELGEGLQVPSALVFNHLRRDTRFWRIYPTQPYPPDTSCRLHPQAGPYPQAHTLPRGHAPSRPRPPRTSPSAPRPLKPCPPEATPFEARAPSPATAGGTR